MKARRPLEFARLDTSGFGFLTSLETGYPVRLPMFGPGFVLEPQAQVVWQRVSFDDANDGLVLPSFPQGKPFNASRRSAR